MSLTNFIGFFVHYKYLAIFPIAVLEGPIVSVFCGFLIYRGDLSFLPAFIVVLSGDAISDSFFYFLGRGGRTYIHKFLKISDERMAIVESQYEKSPWKTMIVAKISYGLGMVFMAASGLAKMSYRKFFYFMGILNAVRSLTLIAIGYYFGKVAIRYGSKYLTYYGVAVAIIVPLTYIIVRKIRRKKQSVKQTEENIDY